MCLALFEMKFVVIETPQQPTNNSFLLFIRAMGNHICCALAVERVGAAVPPPSGTLSGSGIQRHYRWKLHIRVTERRCNAQPQNDDYVGGVDDMSAAAPLTDESLCRLFAFSSTSSSFASAAPGGVANDHDDSAISPLPSPASRSQCAFLSSVESLLLQSTAGPSDSHGIESVVLTVDPQLRLGKAMQQRHHGEDEVDDHQHLSSSSSSPHQRLWFGYRDRLSTRQDRRNTVTANTVTGGGDGSSRDPRQEVHDALVMLLAGLYAASVAATQVTAAASPTTGRPQMVVRFAPPEVLLHTLDLSSAQLVVDDAHWMASILADKCERSAAASKSAQSFVRDAWLAGPPGWKRLDELPSEIALHVMANTVAGGLQCLLLRDVLRMNAAGASKLVRVLLQPPTVTAVEASAWEATVSCPALRRVDLRCSGQQPPSAMLHRAADEWNRQLLDRWRLRRGAMPKGERHSGELHRDDGDETLPVVITVGSFDPEIDSDASDSLPWVFVTKPAHTPDKDPADATEPRAGGSGNEAPKASTAAGTPAALFSAPVTSPSAASSSSQQQRVPTVIVAAPNVAVKHQHQREGRAQGSSGSSALNSLLVHAAQTHPSSVSPSSSSSLPPLSTSPLTSSPTLTAALTASPDPPRRNARITLHTDHAVSASHSSPTDQRPNDQRPLSPPPLPVASAQSTHSIAGASLAASRKQLLQLDEAAARAQLMHSSWSHTCTVRMPQLWGLVVEARDRLIRYAGGEAQLGGVAAAAPLRITAMVQDAMPLHVRAVHIAASMVKCLAFIGHAVNTELHRLADDLHACGALEGDRTRNGGGCYGERVSLEIHRLVYEDELSPWAEVEAMLTPPPQQPNPAANTASTKSTNANTGNPTMDAVVQDVLAMLCSDERFSWASRQDRAAVDRRATKSPAAKRRSNIPHQPVSSSSASTLPSQLVQWQGLMHRMCTSSFLPPLEMALTDADEQRWVGDALLRMMADLAEAAHSITSTLFVKWNVQWMERWSVLLKRWLVENEIYRRQLARAINRQVVVSSTGGGGASARDAYMKTPTRSSAAPAAATQSPTAGSSRSTHHPPLVVPSSSRAPLSSPTRPLTASTVPISPPHVHSPSSDPQLKKKELTAGPTQRLNRLPPSASRPQVTTFYDATVADDEVGGGDSQSMMSSATYEIPTGATAVVGRSQRAFGNVKQVQAASTQAAFPSAFAAEQLHHEPPLSPRVTNASALKKITVLEKKIAELEADRRDMELKRKWGGGTTTSTSGGGAIAVVDSATNGSGRRAAPSYTNPSSASSGASNHRTKGEASSKHQPSSGGGRGDRQRDDAADEPEPQPAPPLPAAGPPHATTRPTEPYRLPVHNNANMIREAARTTISDVVVAAQSGSGLGAFQYITTPPMQHQQQQQQRHVEQAPQFRWLPSMMSGAPAASLTCHQPPPPSVTLEAAHVAQELLFFKPFSASMVVDDAAGVAAQRRRMKATVAAVATDDVLAYMVTRCSTPPQAMHATQQKQHPSTRSELSKERAHHSVRQRQPSSGGSFANSNGGESEVPRGRDEVDLGYFRSLSSASHETAAGGGDDNASTSDSLYTV